MLDVGKFEKGNKEGLSRSVALLILKRPFVAVPVTKPVSHCLQLRMAEWRGRLGCLEPIGAHCGVAHLPQEKFQRRFSALNGLELRLHASSFLKAPIRIALSLALRM